MDQDGGSGKKNAIAVALMVVVLAGSGFYIYSRYQKQQDDEAKLKTLVPDVHPDEIRAMHRRTERASEAATKFVPLLREARRRNEEEAAKTEKEGKMPFAIPGSQPAEGGAEGAAPAPAEGGNSSGGEQPAEAPPSN